MQAPANALIASLARRVERARALLDAARRRARPPLARAQAALEEAPLLGALWRAWRFGLASLLGRPVAARYRLDAAPPLSLEAVVRARDPAFRLVDERRHEQRALEALAARARPGDTIVDAGAGRGVFTILLARLVGPGGRVLALEENARERAALREHVALSRLENVEVPDPPPPSVDAACRERGLRPDGLRLRGRAALAGAKETRREASPWVLLSLGAGTPERVRDEAIASLAPDAEEASILQRPDGAALLFAAPPLEAALGPFVGDPRAWVQPGDERVLPGDEGLGWGLLERWRAARRVYAEPPPPLPTLPAEPATRLFVHSTRHALYEAEKGPHALCEAQDLVVDFSRLRPARTLRFRPRYKKGDGPQYHRYEEGALSGRCRRAEEFRLESFPTDHLRDVFASFRAEERTPPHDAVVEHPVLLVTREGEESRNIFHTTTDFLNALETVLVLGGVDRQELEVVLLDNAPPAPFDRAWPRLFAPRRGVRRVRDFAGRRVLFRRALFSPPGYHSPFFTDLHAEGPERGRVGLLDAFSALVLRAHGIAPRASAPAGGPLAATLVVRRPYETHEYMGRRLANEEACLAALASAPGVAARAVDFARHPLEEQVRIAATSDILAGVHGGALTHLLWMPAHGGVLEVDAAKGRGWRCFRNLARWTGREYETIAAEERPARLGTEVEVDPARLAAAARSIAERVRARRAEAPS